MSLAHINIITTDEPLLMMEACDSIVEQAKQSGVSERKIVEADDKFNWTELLVDSGSLSLFAELKLTDIRFPKLPNKAAQEALVELVESASPENLFLIRLPKMDKRQKGTKWFKALATKANVQEIWPPKAQEFSGWIKQRAQQYHLSISHDACQMLAEQTEGNLLAAKQSLQKLTLLHMNDSAEIGLAEMAAVTSNSARYSVFLCLDEAMAGRGERAVRMLHQFKLEGVAPISILVNLTREINQCNQVALAGLNGQSPMQALSRTFLWDSKKRLIATAVGKLSVAVWQRLVIRCAYLDRMIKGQESGDIWNELELCLWMIAGQRIWGRAS